MPRTLTDLRTSLTPDQLDQLLSSTHIRIPDEFLNGMHRTGRTATGRVPAAFTVPPVTISPAAAWPLGQDPVGIIDAPPAPAPIEQEEISLYMPVGPEYEKHANTRGISFATFYREAVRKMLRDKATNYAWSSLNEDDLGRPRYYDIDCFSFPAMVTDEDTGKSIVKPRQHYKKGYLVNVAGDTSAWGNTSTLHKFVGYITEVEDNHLRVKVLAGSGEAPFNPVVNGRTGRECVEYKVTKRSSTIICPHSLPVAWYVAANHYCRVGKNKRLIAAKQARWSSSPMNPANDPRMQYPNFFSDSYVIKAKFKAANIKMRRARGRFAAYVTAVLRRGDLSVLNDGRIVDLMRRRVPYAQQENFSINSVRDTIINRYNDRTSMDTHILRTDCGHYARHADTTSVYRVRYEGWERVCADCARDRVVQAQRADGSMVAVFRDDTFYTWSDGTNRVDREPSIVGQYHSSRSLVGLLSEPKGLEGKSSGLTLGIELEMEASSGQIEREEDRNALAMAVRNRMMAAHEAGGIPVSNGHRQYGFFERDGSVGHGFEMVTSYGGLAVHQYFINRIFGPTEGETKMPFIGKLRSHDASASCGLHVHMAKPKSMMHAAKLQAFYQDAGNRLLLRCVARRLNVSYAKVAVGKDKENIARNTRKALDGTGAKLTRYNRMRGRSERQAIVSKAITLLSENDRYQMVNFGNEKTVEIRVFKGSMLPTTILACVEFAHASWYFSRDMSAGNLTSDVFLAWICDPVRRHETANLRCYLEARGYKLYVPKKHDSQPERVHEFNAEEA